MLSYSKRKSPVFEIWLADLEFFETFDLPLCFPLWLGSVWRSGGRLTVLLWLGNASTLLVVCKLTLLISFLWLNCNRQFNLMQAFKVWAKIKYIICHIVD